MDLTDATVLVTGASRGIGRALLAAFAAEGATVVGCARDDDTLDDAVETVREHLADAADDSPAGSVEGVTADVREESDVAHLIDVAADAGDRAGVDVVVANAGVKHSASGEMPIHEERYEDFDDTVRTNLRGVFATAKEALDRMPSGGRILVPSGVIAVDHDPGMGAYAVSKGAVEALVRQLAVDVEQTVAIVDPGLVDTDLSAPGGRDPEEVAQLFVWAATEADPAEIDGERVDLKTWMRATRSR
ncbi:SDR family NAD(P)-dependent oxidoreductase [Halobellus sp. Atlit-31R]|nr:SDR family NAD(P)-dependent oxidoreductase [Halobellus sp. Atlit-31R]